MIDDILAPGEPKTTVLLTIRYRTGWNSAYGAEIQGTWTDVASVPWRELRPKLLGWLWDKPTDGASLENYAGRLIGEKGARLCIELLDENRNRLDQRELTAINGRIVLKEAPAPTRPGANSEKLLQRAVPQ